MSDQFFKDPRPFTKRKREEGPNAAGAGRSGSGSGRSFGERGGRGGSRGSDRGGRGSRGSSRGDRGSSRGARGGGRGGRGAPVVESGNSKRRAQEMEDEELDEPGAGGGGFDSDEALGEDAEEEEEDSSEEEDDVNETPAQKRLRLSQMYLKTLEKDTSREDIGFNAADLDRDLIAERLQQDVLEHSGKLHLNIGESLLLPIPSSSIHFTPSAGHRGPVTAAVATEDGSWLYTSSKDGSIIKWDLRPIITSSSPSSSSPSTSTPAPRILKAVYFPKKKGESANRNPEIRKQKDLLLEQEKAKARGKEKGNVKGKGKSKAEEIGGHTDEILTLAVSFDGKILASGGKDKVVGVWDVSGEDGRWMRGLGGHKDKVASIAFRQGTLQLYSSSFDRSVKLFDLSTLSYVETLFGHQDCIQHVAALRSELAVSAGGRDKTIRFWKIAEESQLVFRGGAASRIRNVLDGAMEDEGVEEEDLRKRKRNRGEVKYVEGSVDCVAMIDDTTFLSGGDSGSICLWNITKKKPISTHQLAHGVSEYTSETEGVIGTARWITALASLGYGDVFASGSWDGSIRLWKIDERVRSFSLLTTIPAPGYINSLQLISPSLRSSEPQSQRQANGKEAKPTKSLVVIAAVAKEPRLGRWMRIKGGKEGALVAVIELGEGARITEDDA